MQKIIDEINKVYDALATYKTKNLKALQQDILKAEKLLLNKKFTPKEEISIIDSCKGKLQRFQSAYERWETEMEIWFAEKIVKSRKFSLTAFEKYPLYARFVTLIKNEIELGKLSESDRVLFIGSGPIPITAILVNKFVNCSVDCFDKNKHYVGLSSEVIKKLNLSKKIRIYRRRENFINSHNYHYTAVIVALLAKPKTNILQGLWKNATHNTRIICRTSDGVRQLFYKETNPKVLKRYNLVTKAYAMQDQTISSVILVKQ